MNDDIRRALSKAERLIERRQKVITLTSQHYTCQQIADILGITERTVQRDKRLAGISHRVNYMTETELAQAKQLLEDGASYCEVGRTLGRAPSTIQDRFPGYGWTMTMVAEFVHMRRKLEALETH